MESLFDQLRAVATSGNDHDRLAVLEGMDKLQLELQTPFESQNKFRLQYMAQFICIRIAQELGVIRQLLAADGSLTISELAEKSGAAEDLLSMHTFHSQGHHIRLTLDRKGSTPASFRTCDCGARKGYFRCQSYYQSLRQPRLGGSACDLVRIYANEHLPFLYSPMISLSATMYQALPGFLAETKYRTPSSNASPAQKVIGTTDTFFGFITKNPTMAARVTQVQSIMSAQTSDRWLDKFPIVQELADWEDSSDRVLFVDLGGGMFEGNQCKNFKARNPHLKGKIILQDLQGVLDHVKSIEGVEFVAQDFFTPQKVLGAKFYYLREVIHDWSDDKVLEILKNLIPALGPGSRILIDDLVLPDVGCSWRAAGADIAIMLIGGAERSKADWERLIAKAGLKIMGMYAYDPQSYKTVIVIGKE